MKRNRNKRWPGWLVGGLALVAVIALSVWVGMQLGQQGGSRETRASSTPNNTQTLTPSENDFILKPAITPSIPSDDSTRLVSTAEASLINGQYQQAATQFRFILQNYPKGTGATAAIAGLARAEHAQGRYKEAAERWQQLLNEYPADSRRSQALFGLAEAQLNLGQWEQAIASYQKYLAEGQENAKAIEGYVYTAIADAYVKGGKQAEAIESLKKTADAKEGGSNLLRAQALDRIGDYLAGQGKADEAATNYNRILEFARVFSYRADTNLKIATAYDKAKKPEQATASYRNVIDQYFGTNAANRAIQTLLERDPAAFDDYWKGYDAYRKGNYSEAITIFDKFLKRPAAGQPLPVLPSNTPAPEQERVARAWLWQAISLEQTGKTDQAIAEYQELSNRLLKTQSGDEAIWRLAQLYRTQNKTAEAISQYGRLNGSTQYAEEAIFAQFQLTLDKDGPDKAAAFAETLMSRNFARGREALFKLAQSFAGQGNQNATLLYRRLSELKTDDYFSVRAEEILSNVNPLAPVTSKKETHPAVYDPERFSTDFEREKAELETWLLGWAIKAGEGSITPASNKIPLDLAQKVVREDVGVRRMVELMRLGRTDQANREGQEAQTRFSGKPLELYWLSLVCNENRQYSISIYSARELFDIYQKQKPQEGLRKAPVLLQKLIYPLNFQDVILEHSARFNIDPLLVSAMIKQESAFDPDATSSAEARGLTQVIPDTGKGIASALKISGFTVEDLYRPHLSVEFGVFYLDNQLDNFKGNPYIALSAYNGGPSNAANWSKANPPENGFDIFVDGISFRETRQYVRIVYTNYAVYRQLYRAR